MNLAEFKNSLAATTPPSGLPISLAALWQDAKGNWAGAHALVQDHEDQQVCNWIHAYLHRKEGDLANAGYWYRRSDKPLSKKSLDEEWTEITTTLLAANPG